MEHQWNKIDRGKPRYSEEKPVPVSLCPPQIPHGLIPGSNPGLRDGRPATNRLSHGTALHIFIKRLFVKLNGISNFNSVLVSLIETKNTNLLRLKSSGMWHRVDIQRRVTTWTARFWGWVNILPKRRHVTVETTQHDLNFYQNCCETLTSRTVERRVCRY
jgi:hypothetical protein